MVYLQFQIVNLTETDHNVMGEFCEYLNNYIFMKLNTKVNRRKIQLRMNYILNEASWVEWNSDKYNLSVTELFSAIYKSLSYEEYRNNTYKLQIDMNILIPRSRTSIDRFIRFLAYGDTKSRATSMFVDIQRDLTAKKLQSLYQLFLLQNGYSSSNVEIITN